MLTFIVLTTLILNLVVINKKLNKKKNLDKKSKFQKCKEIIYNQLFKYINNLTDFIKETTLIDKLIPIYPEPKYKILQKQIRHN